MFWLPILLIFLNLPGLSILGRGYLFVSRDNINNRFFIFFLHSCGNLPTLQKLNLFVIIWKWTMYTNTFFLHLYSYQNEKVTGNSLKWAIFGLTYYLFSSLPVIFLHSKLQFWPFTYIFVVTWSIIYSRLFNPQFWSQVPRTSIYSVEEVKDAAKKQLLVEAASKNWKLKWATEKSVKKSHLNHMSNHMSIHYLDKPHICTTSQFCHSV